MTKCCPKKFTTIGDNIIQFDIISKFTGQVVDTANTDFTVNQNDTFYRSGMCGMPSKAKKRGKTNKRIAEEYNNFWPYGQSERHHIKGIEAVGENHLIFHCDSGYHITKTMHDVRNGYTYDYSRDGGDGTTYYEWSTNLKKGKWKHSKKRSYVANNKSGTISGMGCIKDDMF